MKRLSQQVFEDLILTEYIFLSITETARQKVRLEEKWVAALEAGKADSDLPDEEKDAGKPESDSQVEKKSKKEDTEKTGSDLPVKKKPKKKETEETNSDLPDEKKPTQKETEKTNPDLPIEKRPSLKEVDRAKEIILMLEDE